FIFRYSQVKLRLSERVRNMLFILFGAFFVLIMTNDWHHLIYRQFVLKPNAFALTYSYGPLFWVWVLVSYICLVMGTARLVLTAIQSVTLFRYHIFLIILGALFPWLGNIFYLLRINPVPGFDPTPVCFSATGIIG